MSRFDEYQKELIERAGVRAQFQNIFSGRFYPSLNQINSDNQAFFATTDGTIQSLSLGFKMRADDGYWYVFDANNQCLGREKVQVKNEKMTNKQKKSGQIVFNIETKYLKYLLFT